MRTINERILECIKRSGLTKTAFGKRIGVSQSFVSQMCSGASSPSTGTIKNICREFNISEDWLLTGEGEAFLPQSKEDVLRDTVERLMPSESADFKRRLVVALSAFQNEHWLLLEEKLKEIVGTQEPVPARADDDIERATEDYRRRLLLEKNQAGKSSPSSEAGTETA